VGVSGAAATASSLAARLASAVRAERTRRGWRAADLAEALGLSVSRVNHIEQARDNPTRATLDRLADVLGVDALPPEAAEIGPVMTPYWATDGVRGNRLPGAYHHAVPRGVVTIAKADGRNVAGSAGVGWEVKRYPCEACDTTCDLERDAPLPPHWRTRTWRTRYGAIATAYICPSCTKEDDR